MPKHVEHEVHSTCCTWSRPGLGILSSTRCSRLLKVKVVIVNPSQKCCITSSSAEKDILFQRNQTFGLNLNPDKSSVWCLQVIGPGEVNPLHRGIKCVQDKGGQKNSLLAAYHQYLHLPLNPQGLRLHLKGGAVSHLRWSPQLSRMDASQAPRRHGRSGSQSSF